MADGGKPRPRHMVETSMEVMDEPRKVGGFLAMRPPTTTHNALEVRYRRSGGRKVPFVGKSEALRAVEDGYLAYLDAYRPERPLEAPLTLSVVYCYATCGRHRQGEPKTTKPDGDNLLKSFKDCLTRAGFIHDDAHIAVETVAREWSDPAGIWFELKEAGA